LPLLLAEHSFLHHPSREDSMSSVIIDCPSCNRKLRVADDLVGKEVKCPTCRSTFQATAGPRTGQITPAPESGASGPSIQRAEPPSGADQQMPSADSESETCPSCGARVPKDAERCPSCQQALDEEADDRPWEERRTFRGRRDAE